MQKPDVQQVNQRMNNFPSGYVSDWSTQWTSFEGDIVENKLPEDRPINSYVDYYELLSTVVTDEKSLLQVKIRDAIILLSRVQDTGEWITALMYSNRQYSSRVKGWRYLIFSLILIAIILAYGSEPNSGVGPLVIMSIIGLALFGWCQYRYRKGQEKVKENNEVIHSLANQHLRFFNNELCKSNFYLQLSNDVNGTWGFHRLWNYLSQGRADNLKEALNLLAQETYQLRLENKIDQSNQNIQYGLQTNNDLIAWNNTLLIWNLLNK